jgi:2-polyprenyl-3-methyl-5-hydroxy-6-metoxy-1,4-benzoquinol methylase
MSAPRVTRGYGLLEGFLAKQRAKMAEKLIPASSREGKILDIGCGTHPFFLLNTLFLEKHGLDKNVRIEKTYSSSEKGITVSNYDIEAEKIIPYDDNSFDVITMLAVIEHLTPNLVVERTKAIHRVLKPGGTFIITTPAFWTDLLLRAMAKFNIVSPVELQEHKASYSHKEIRLLLNSAGFPDEHINHGYFELCMNLWITARKGE